MAAFSFFECLHSSLPSILVACSLLLLLVYPLLKNSLNQRHRRREKHNLPSGPPKLPIIGHLHLLGTNPHLSLTRLSETFGPIFRLQLGHIPSVVITSVKLAKEILTTHDINFSSRPQLYAAKHLFYNCTDMAFSPYGAYWRHIRKICILELLSAKQVQSGSFIREEAIARLVHRVQEAYPGTTNLTNNLCLYANDVLCRAAFGRDFTSAGEYDQHGFQKLLEEYQVLLGGFSVGDYFPSMEWINTLNGTKSRLVKTFQRFDKFFDYIIEEHLNPNRVREGHRDLVDVLLDLQKSGSLDMALTMDNIKAVILDMFAAGTDTTFATLDWGMTELVMNPKAMQKAQAEVRSVMGDRKVVVDRDLTELPYLKAVMKETLRLHPPSPLIPREAMEAVVIDGYEVPSKGRIYINVWAISRDPKLWENPESFEPERFMDGSIDFKGMDFELIPFGAGRRSCPAITFGVASMELALAQLLHSFDYELPPGVEAKDLDKTDVFGVTMHRQSKLIVIARPLFS